MTPSPRCISDDVRSVLSAGRCEDALYFLPKIQLDRKLYERTNQVLEALGGQWERKSKAHRFPWACEDRIEQAIESGLFDLPKDYGWFPTPASLADLVVCAADVRPGERVLEPSAGEGAIVKAAIRAKALVHAVEINQDRAAVLRGIEGITEVAVGDFLELTPRPIFDSVLMNPPFAKRADIHHVQHARRFLKPGGRLVAIMAAGVMFRQDRLTTDFRVACRSINQLPSGSFHESGTDVETVIVTIDG